MREVFQGKHGERFDLGAGRRRYRPSPRARESPEAEPGGDEHDRNGAGDSKALTLRPRRRRSPRKGSSRRQTAGRQRGHRELGRDRRRSADETPQEAPQIHEHVAGRLVAVVAVLFERLEDDVFQLLGQVRVDLPGRHGRPLEDPAQDHGRCFAAERELTDGHGVEERPEREEVRARVELLAADLLRRHERHRAHRSARRGQVGHRGL